MPLAESSRYCAKCGQRADVSRLTLRSVIGYVFEHTFDIDAPFLRTIRDLAWRPGFVASEYVEWRRRTYSNPLKFCALIVALELAAIELSGFDFNVFPQAVGSGGAAADEMDQLVQAILDRALAWNIKYIGLLTFLTLPALAGLMRVLCFCGGRNFAEHYAMALFVMRECYLLQAPAILLTALGWNTPFWIISLLVVIYYLLAAVRFCRGRAWVLVLKGLLAYLVYLVVFTALLFGFAALWTLAFDSAAVSGGA